MCANISEHNVRTLASNVMRVYGTQKKLGNFYCSIVATTYSRTILTIVNCIATMQIIVACNMLAIIFWLVKNLTMYMLHALRRVANSLRTILASSYMVVVAKEIYFFNFFAHKKLKKIAHITHTWVPCRHMLRHSKRLSKKYSRLRFWTPQMCRSELSEIVLFVRFPDMSRKSRNLKNLQKLSDLAKIVRSAKICKNRKISKKSIFWHFGMDHTDLPKIAKISTFRHFGGFVQICGKSVRTQNFAKFCRFLTSAKVQKKSKICG